MVSPLLATAQKEGPKTVKNLILLLAAMVALAMVAIGLFQIAGGKKTAPRKSRVTEATRLHTGRYGHAAVSDSNRVYVIGGYSADGLLGTIEAIDPVSGASEVVASNLIPRRYLTAVQVNGEIYIVGGVSSAGYEPTVEIYDIASGVVSHAPSLPTPRRLAKAVAIGDRIYVVGGQSIQADAPEERTGRVEVYDILSRSWEQAATMPTARECAVVVAEEQLFAIGGYAGGAGGLSAFEVFDPINDRWTTGADLPFIMSAHSAVAIEDGVFTFGDYEQLDRVAMYHLDSGEWTLLDLDFKPSRHNAAVVFKNEVFVIGGNIASTESHLDAIQRFSIEQLERARLTHQ